MKKIALIIFSFFVLFMLFTLLTLTNTAFASNWVFFGKVSNIFQTTSSQYIDSDSIFKDGNKLTYWSLEVLDKPQSHYAKAMMKLEVNLATPRKLRVLENYSFDAKNMENYKDTTASAWENASPRYDKEIAFALKYAKEGKDTSTKPTVP